jgi:hypothetical protein
VRAFELRVFHQGLVFLFVAKMGVLKYDVAQVLAMQLAFAFRIILGVFFRHFQVPFEDCPGV